MEFIAPPLLELGDHGAVHNGRSIIRLCALLHHLQTPEPTLHALTVQHETENPRLSERQARQEKELLEEKADNQLSVEQREEIKAAFSHFDLDKDDKIGYLECIFAFGALSVKPPEAELLCIFKDHEEPTEPHQLLPYARFETVTTPLILARDPREEFLRGFAGFDKEGKGKIDLDDLRRVARELGEDSGEEELADMIRAFDTDNDGAINIEDWLNIMLS